MAFESGTAAVYPSAHVNTIQLSTEGSAPADCRVVARRTPVHSAVLFRFPPTSLLTHSRVTNSSTVASGGGPRGGRGFVVGRRPRVTGAIGLGPRPGRPHCGARRRT